ncbi:hypothetical protein SAMN05421666_2028 [Roseovarius nanhaiticus]|uniref:Ferrochelatase n=2 Tax=Roseovarius nanhaiticus TaxID=573024 RepID=A0A1N7GFU5_9RHOB|nr:hypothetical protein [Roseovarius nanhaiticus]SEK27324.1 hypothetical protein SAMN05216208_0107 [Roseovarius nanhaiticus]SIS11441.1 hypothetical protein SAMN05421666_2028 [Roseovarius nanhaiticus]
MKTYCLAAIAAATFAAAPVMAGNLAEPVMEPAIIEAETASSSANQAEIVALSLTALVFLTALISAN